MQQFAPRLGQREIGAKGPPTGSIQLFRGIVKVVQLNLTR
jgi:hypothetical protein